MNAKEALWILLGAAVGAGAGYAIATIIYDQVVNEDEEYEYEEETEEEEEDIETVIPDKTKKKEKKERTDYSGMYRGADVRPELKDLVKKYKEGSDVETEDDSEIEEISEEFNEEPDPTKPYLIERIEFEQDFKKHKKEYLYYYEDEILARADDGTILTSDPVKFLGPDALVSFGLNEEEHPDYVHVRNEILGVDYEIQWIHDAYKKPEKKKKRERFVPEEEVDD